MRASRYIPLIAVLAAVVAIIRARRPEPAPAAPAGSAAWPPLDLPADDDVPAGAASEESATEPADTPDWVEPEADGSCPVTHPVKLNEPSGIFHVPGGQFYGRTKAERCYASAEAAEADGFRASRR